MVIGSQAPALVGLSETAGSGSGASPQLVTATCQSAPPLLSQTPAPLLKTTSMAVVFVGMT